LATAPVLAADSNAEKPIVDILQRLAMTSDSIDRVTLANRLERLILLARPDDVSRSTIDQLGALLNDQSDVVRWKISFALGFVGQKASTTIPALEMALLNVREERNASLSKGEAFVGAGFTSGFTICQTLMTFKVDPLPSDCAFYMETR
jgi:hypothetical protein